ncbi:hypothetical protein [Clostridium sp.]|uniref:hypothetical protein n=1 Tax=Clostridium sp. TaxID=1506 RepID=UPI003217AB5D
MCEIITNKFKSSTIKLAVTGLPIVITGEVLSSSNANLLAIRLSNGTNVYITTNLIAFFY